MGTAPTFPELRDQLDALTDLVRELSAQREVGDVLDVALRQCLTLTSSEFGFVSLINAASSEMEIVAIHGFHPAPSFFAEHRVIPLRPNLFSRVVLDDRPVRSVDATLEPQGVGQPDGHPVVRAFLGAPLRLDGVPMGMIGLANRASPYQDDHELLVMTYASLISVLVHKAQLYEKLQGANERLERLVNDRTAELAQARDALAEKAARLQQVLTDTVDAQEQERQRIAGDIHDGINQLLIGAMLEVTSGMRRIEAGQMRGAHAVLDSARSILAQVEAEIQQVVHDLHPPILAGLGLPAAIRHVVDLFESFSDIECMLEVTGRATRLAPKAEISLYRIVQEGLRNVAVHARATRVDVVLAFAPEEVAVTLVDNGQGFDPQALDHALPATDGGHHLGLESMRRRVESLGGSWQLDSSIGCGTTIRALVPVE